MEQQEVKGDAITPESNPIAYTLSVTTPDEVVAVVNNPEIKPHARPTYELTRNVFFVGFMVAGKTSTSRRLARQCGLATIVYLQVTAEQAVERVGDVSTRPLFKNLETARQTIAGRLPMYEDVASVSIDTVGKSINVVAQEIQEILEKEGVLCLRQE